MSLKAWVTPSFSDSDKKLSSKTSQSKTRHHRPGRTGHGRNRDEEQDMWADRNIPKNKGDLCVHKKKIQDLETFLEDHCQQMTASLLLISGPVGCGKSTTIRVLSKELNIQLHEWINTTKSYSNTASGWGSRTDDKLFDRGDYNDGERVFQTQASLFYEFVSKCDKYNPLPMSNEPRTCSRKIILVEEYPPAFFKDPKSFHDILRGHRRKGHCPIVCVVTESQTENTMRQLFPVHTQEELSIQTFTFNAIPPTVMVKVIERMARTELNKTGKLTPSMPSNQVLETITDLSGGDLRSAINSLQFTCLKDSVDIERSLSNSGLLRDPVSKRFKKGGSIAPKKSSRKSTRRDTDSMACIGARDQSLFLFRALGRILYCKRETSSKPDIDCTLLPAHMKHMERDLIIEQPEVIVDRCNISTSLFTLYLHENCVELMSGIDDIVNVSAYFSDSDILSSNWMNQDVLSNYAVSIAARGFIYCNSEPDSVTKPPVSYTWKPLHKPQCLSINKQVRETLDNARVLFSMYHWRPEIMMTAILPYLSLCHFPVKSPGQAALLKSVTQYSNTQSRRVKSLERLTDSGLSVDEDIESVTRVGRYPHTQNKDITVISLEDIDTDTIKIDDYDSS